MKKTLLFITMATVAVLMGCETTKVSEERDYAYEAYCDSIWANDPDYYVDVLEETDEYVVYLEHHKKWWED